jgi:glycosyltransferase involved in cell wall biosynthesis
MLLSHDKCDDGADVAVVLGTFGDRKWIALGERAYASVKRQTMRPKEIVRVHGETLAMARNEGSLRARSRFQIFLDADDELHEEYVAEMISADGDIRVPSVERFIDLRSQGAPHLLPKKVHLRFGNHIVVGAMHERDRFLSAGGFEEYVIAEDYALWLRMHFFFGASRIVEVPRAIYKIHQLAGSRNTGNGDAVFHSILRRYKI